MMHPTLHVLVVDDVVVRRAVARLLEANGFRVSTAVNGREALALVRDGDRPRLVLLDLDMPDVDGWAFLRERERDPLVASVPVVVVSSDDKSEGRAIAAGAKDFLCQPFMTAHLLGAIRAAVRP